MRKRLVARSEAKPTTKQHRSPCCDCPFRRDSLPGWLGGSTPEQFVRHAHADLPYPCHTKIGPQCAGMAIYRANICKSPRDPKAFRLPADKVKVFSWPTEFINHHSTATDKTD